MSRLPMKTLFRSLALTSLMSSRWMLKPSIAIMGVIARSKSPFLDPDRNPLLNTLLRWTVYNHFCAGTNAREVMRSVADFKKLGFQGVILTHAKEILLEQTGESRAADGADYSPAAYKMVDMWKQYSLETLRMLQPGDFLALK